MRGPTNLLKTFMVLIVDRTIDLEKPVVKKRPGFWRFALQYSDARARPSKRISAQSMSR